MFNERIWLRIETNSSLLKDWQEKSMWSGWIVRIKIKYRRFNGEKQRKISTADRYWKRWRTNSFGRSSNFKPIFVLNSTLDRSIQLLSFVLHSFIFFVINIDIGEENVHWRMRTTDAVVWQSMRRWIREHFVFHQALEYCFSIVFFFIFIEKRKKNVSLRRNLFPLHKLFFTIYKYIFINSIYFIY